MPIPNDATPKHMMMKQTVCNTLKSTMTEMLGSFATAIRTKSQYSAQTIPKTTKTMFLKDFILFLILGFAARMPSKVSPARRNQTAWQHYALF
jgi:hypothetical protein